MSTIDGESPRAFPDGRPAEDQPDWRQDFPTDVPEDDHVARREFTKFLVLTSGAFAAGQCWIAASSSLEARGPHPSRPIGRLAEIPVGGVLEFRYPDADHPCLLIRPASERLVAYSQQCTHLSCAVVPELDLGRLRCPCHNGYFEIDEGRPIAGPPKRPLPRITLEVREGTVYATGLESRLT
jgi:nitrite reductase/ring-hydroxylating ferredoxin subunit